MDYIVDICLWPKMMDSEYKKWYRIHDEKKNKFLQNLTLFWPEHRSVSISILFTGKKLQIANGYYR